jgi:RNA-directed DNA polymerase
MDKNGFLKIIGSVGRELCKSTVIPPIPSVAIEEFKIRKKYLYRFKVESDYKEVQKSLLSNYLNEIPLNNSAIAFRKNKSYLNFLEPHKNSFYFVRLDITNFFHSISKNLIIDRFSDDFDDVYLDDNDKQKLIDGFINLISYQIPLESDNKKFCEEVVLPIGFKTSPVISNIVFRKIDILIQNYCTSHQITYTRYADDMLFSSSKVSKFVHSETFYSEIKYLVGVDKFKLNERKTIKSSHTISLNGYIVEANEVGDKAGTIRISNKKTKIIEQLIYELKNEKTQQEIMTKLFDFRVSSKYFRFMPPKPEFIEKYCKDQLFGKIVGYRSYLISVIQFDKKFSCVDKKALEKYSTLIDKLNKYIDKM